MKRLTTMPVESGETIHINTGDIPAYVATNLAQAVFEAIHQAYNDPAIQDDYIRWKAEKAHNQKKGSTL